MGHLLNRHPDFMEGGVLRAVTPEIHLFMCVIRRIDVVLEFARSLFR